MPSRASVPSLGGLLLTSIGSPPRAAWLAACCSPCSAPLVLPRRDRPNEEEAGPYLRPLLHERPGITGCRWPVSFSLVPCDILVRGGVCRCFPRDDPGWGVLGGWAASWASGDRLRIVRPRPTPARAWAARPPGPAGQCSSGAPCSLAVPALSPCVWRGADPSGVVIVGGAWQSLQPSSP